MAAKEQIDKAVAAHGMWKARLRIAIDTGKSDFDPAVVRTDSKCDFGKWLYTDIAPELKASAQFSTIKTLHAAFHVEAGRILQLALAGKKAEAEKEMSTGSKFDTTSSSLTRAMIEWKKTATS